MSVHTHERFAFTVSAALPEVAPLFGPLGERAWAPGWNPRVLHPTPPMDTRGMVFTIPAHDEGDADAVWVATELDVANGRMQYVYVVPQKMTTLITVRLLAQGERTRVEVEYERTALTAAAAVAVRKLAEEDRVAGAEWAAHISEHLTSKP